MADAAHPAWEIESGITDPVKFFGLLPSVLPEATLFFAEGTSVAPDVRRCYRQHAERGPFLPKRQTVWPRSALYRCLASPALYKALAALSQTHVAPELLDHLSVYQGDTPLLWWHDAFDNVVRLAASLPENQVAALATSFGRRYYRVQPERP